MPQPAATATVVNANAVFLSISKFFNNKRKLMTYQNLTACSTYNKIDNEDPKHS